MCDFYNNLSEHEKEVYNNYKRNINRYAYKLNTALRLNKFSEFETDVNLLDGIVDSNRTENAIKLYRAAYDSIVLDFIDEDQYSNPEFLSTSKDAESIQKHFTEYDPIYIIINCPSGAAMVSMESNEMSSGLEFEILLGRNNVFDIIENRFITERKQLDFIMGKDKSEGVSRLRLLRLNLRV